jgi:hypothetical protein
MPGVAKPINNSDDTCQDRTGLCNPSYPRANMSYALFGGLFLLGKHWFTLELYVVLIGPQGLW